MVVVAPPRPPREDVDLEALIEEARRRARRRRLLVAAVVALGLALAGGILAVVLLTRGGGSTQSVPPGFHLVRAGGTVEHGRIQEVGKVMPILVDEQTGKTKRPGLTMDIWWDRKTNLVRAVGGYDGRVAFDLVGNTCLRGTRSTICVPPEVFDASKSAGLAWPLDPKFHRITGRGRIRGHDVIWVTTLDSNGSAAPRGSERVALDARTHQLVARMEYYRDRAFARTYYSRLSDLPAKRVSFVVPDGGAVRGVFPPFGGQAQHVRRSSLGAIRSTLGVTPLWLGPRFHGKHLTSVEVGTLATEARDGSPLRPAKFVRLNYGDLKLQEFPADSGPFYYLQGPRRGKLALDGSGVTVTRSGVLVFARAPALFSAKSAIAFARALQPLASA
jgi:hypothetical protein